MIIIITLPSNDSITFPKYFAGWKYPKNVRNFEKQPKATMWQIDDAAVHAMSLKCDDAPKSAWRKKQRVW